MVTDVFVIGSGTSNRHVRSLADDVEMKLREMDVRPLRREGADYGHWVLLDYGDVVVHLFDTETRDFFAVYGAEKKELAARAELARLVESGEALGYAPSALVRDKDGISSALRLADLAARLKSEGRSLLDARDALWREHGFVADRQVSLRFDGPEAQARMSELVERVRREPPTELGGARVLEVLEPDTQSGGELAGDPDLPGVEGIETRRTDHPHGVDLGRDEVTDVLELAVGVGVAVRDVERCDLARSSCLRLDGADHLLAPAVALHGVRDTDGVAIVLRDDRSSPKAGGREGQAGRAGEELPVLVIHVTPCPPHMKVALMARQAQRASGPVEQSVIACRSTPPRYA